MPTRLLKVKRLAGVAGQFAVVATVEHTFDGEAETSTVMFVGSTYGGPVVMRTTSARGNPVETFVTDPWRFGKFGVAWVERFFADA